MSKKEEVLQKDTTSATDTEKRETERIAPVQSLGKLMIYIGPTFKGAARGTVYNNGLPQVLKEAIKKKPVIGQLLVPVTNLSIANKGLADPNSALSRLYRIAEDYLKKGE